MPRSILCKLQLGLAPDFKFELLPLHSPLLGQSLLVSFPPLIDMLKFSGYPYLIRGQNEGLLDGREPAESLQERKVLREKPAKPLPMDLGRVHAESADRRPTPSVSLRV